MLAMFYYNPVKSGVDEYGVDNYEDRVFIKITRDITHTVNRQAKEEDFARFPAEYKYFQKSSAKYEPLEDGLPLEFWPVASPSEVMNLKGHGIRTVQNLAKADPNKMPSTFSGLVQFARNYMKIAGAVAKSTKLITDLTEENKQLKEDLGIARAELEALRRATAKEEAA
jgi:hypothetical protein